MIPRTGMVTLDAFIARFIRRLLVLFPVMRKTFIAIEELFSMSSLCQ